jgi:hypothetical protein
MAKQTPNIIKGWFITFAKPVQQQFWDWVDSFRHKDDPIVFDDLGNELKELIQSIGGASSLRPEEITLLANGSFLMLEKYRLNAVAVKNNSGQNTVIALGTAPGASDIAEINVLDGDTASIDLGLWFWAETEIFVSNVFGEMIFLIDRK